MSPAWTMTATGGGRAIDAVEVRRALGILLDPRGAHELRSAPSGRTRIVQGSDLDGAIEKAQELSDDRYVWYSINPVRVDLDHACKVADVLSRRWVLIDIDRPKAVQPDESATQEERLQAEKLSDRIVGWLSGQGWPVPVMIDSGNGRHLLYRVDLPNDELSRVLVGKFLKGIAERWKSEAAKIGVECYNANRFAKLPGTWSRRGTDTPDRPHRMARLIVVPDPIEIVSVDLIEAASDPRAVGGKVVICGQGEGLMNGLAAAWNIPVPPNGVTPNGNGTTHSPWTAQAPAGPSVEERAIAYLATVEPAISGRKGHNKTFGVACRVGPGFDLSASEAFRLIQAHYNPRCEPPWKDRDLWHKIESAYETETRRGWLLNEPGRNGHHVPSSGLAPGESMVIGLDEVEPKKVEWVSQDRIAIGFISLLAGRTGLGKSFVMCDYTARLSRGLVLPEGDANPLPPSRTLIISEDPIEYMLAPRLIELGADRSMVKFMKWKAMAQFSLGNTGMLDQLYEQAGHPLLVWVDPPATFLGGKDEHKNAEVRGVLMPLVAWLDTKHVACVLITHINKQIGKGLEALDRIMGSVAWASTSRITLAFARDPGNPEQCIFGGLKNNLGEKAKPLVYAIVKTDTFAKVEWRGEATTSADDAVSSVGKPLRRIVAAEWIVEQFRAKLEWPSEELIKNAHSHGISRSACFEAKKALELPKARRVAEENGDICWVWWVPPDWEGFEKYPAAKA